MGKSDTITLPPFIASSQVLTTNPWIEVVKKGTQLRWYDLRFSSNRKVDSRQDPDNVNSQQSNGYRVVGRSVSKSDIVLENKTVSKQHAILFHHKDGGLYLLDLGSSKGTTLNGSRLSKEQPVRLSEGSCIQFGISSTDFIVHLDDPPFHPTASSGAASIAAETEATPTDQVKPIVPTGGSSSTDKTTNEMPSKPTQKLPKQGTTDQAVPIGGSSSTDNTTIEMPLKPTQVQPKQGTTDQINGPTDLGQSSRAQREAEIRAITESMLRGPAKFQKSAEQLERERIEEEENKQIEAMEAEVFEAQKRINEKELVVEAICQQYRFPATNEAQLRGHSKMVCSVSVDAAGARVASGGLDAQVRLWDFAGMDQHRRSFKGFTPQEGYPVTSVVYNATGSLLMVVTASPQVKVFDRDGNQVSVTIRGDQYIRNMEKTKGHVGIVRGGVWHPRNKHMMITAASDGTCRVWDVANGQTSLLNKELICGTVLKGIDSRNSRIALTCCAINNQGTWLAASGADMSIQLWKFKGIAKYSTPHIVLRGAHEPIQNSIISSLCFSTNGTMLASRSGINQSTLKLWELKEPKTLSGPVKEFQSLPNERGYSNVVFSPDNQHMLTGTSVTGVGEQELPGELVFLPVEGLSTEPTLRLPIGKGLSIGATVWHNKLNQIVFGTSDGKVRVMFDPELSAKGALVGAKKNFTKKSEYSTADFAMDADVVTGKVYNPNSLPMYREQIFTNKRKRAEKVRNDPVATKKPALPTTGQKIVGKSEIRVAKNSFTEQYLQSTIRNNIRAQDPREELLKYSNNDGSSYFTGSAYASTQPKPILHETTLEEEEILHNKVKNDLEEYKRVTGRK